MCSEDCLKLQNLIFLSTSARKQTVSTGIFSRVFSLSSRGISLSSSLSLFCPPTQPPTAAARTRGLPGGDPVGTVAGDPAGTAPGDPKGELDCPASEPAPACLDWTGDAGNPV